jgi:hypothetical protein
MGRGIGNIFGAVAPIAAGYFGGPALARLTGWRYNCGAIAAGALAGGGIAALSGQDILTGAAMGGLSGYGGGQMQAAFNPTQALMQPGVDLTAAELNAATNASLTNGATAAGVQLPADAVNPLTQGTDLFASGSNIPGQGAGINNMASFSTPQTPNIMAGQMPAGVGGIPGTNLTDPSTIPQLDTSFSAGVKRLGGDSTAMGYGKMGLTGLGALSSMPVETQTWDSVKDKYDPNSRLNLNMDTGIDEALRKDSGLRLYNQGGRVQRYEEGGLTLNLNTGETQGERASLMPPPAVPGLFGQQRVDPSFKAYDPNKDKLTLAPAGAQGGSSSMYGFYDVSGKFNQTDANSPNAQLYNYGPQETTAQQNQGGAGGPQSFSGNQGGVDPVTAIAALRAAQGSAAQQEAPYKNQTLGLSSLAGGGYLETGGVVGDGMSDEIPATIDGEQEARLSDGEFVLPADIVSHLGNGSSDAGAKQLYSMMDRIRQARTGSKKQGTEIDVGRYMPA